MAQDNPETGLMNYPSLNSLFFLNDCMCNTSLASVGLDCRAVSWLYGGPSGAMIQSVILQWLHARVTCSSFWVTPTVAYGVRLYKCRTTHRANWQVVDDFFSVATHPPACHAAGQAVSIHTPLLQQGMSYANSAGLPSVYGLYGAFLPCLVYSLVGSSNQLAVGPVCTSMGWGHM